MSKKRTLLIRWIVCVVAVAAVTVMAIPSMLRPRERGRTTTILNDARLLDAAVDQWAIERNAAPETKVTWEEIAPYLKPRTRLRESGGKDMWGNPFIIGPTRQDGVKFSPATLLRYDSSIVPPEFWGEYR